MGQVANTAGGAALYVPSFNGVAFELLAGTIGSGNAVYGMHIFYNPPVGTYSLSMTGGMGNGTSWVAVILGADKRTTNPLILTSALGTSASIAVPTAGSLVIWYGPSSTTSTEQISGLPFSYQYVNAGTAQATFANNPMYALALEPDDAPSIWYPEISTRNAISLFGPPAIGINISSKVFPTSFWQNSFLHTIGRVIPSPSGLLGPAAELEQQTSQITIDKVYQGTSSGGNPLTIDVSIPSNDAVLVVTGGSVIATGSNWVSVTYNGGLGTSLVDRVTNGADAEIWLFSAPPVGVSQLVITPAATFGQAYVNAFVLLGVDKKSANLQVAQAQNTVGTNISTSLTPDAPNSLMINVLAALDTSGRPTPQQNQNQMFAPTGINANEYVEVGFQLSSNTQNIAYSLGVASNASLVVVTFRPANAASIWYPNIDLRQLDTVVDANALDAGTTPIPGVYGYNPTLFYQNSFLHTVGKIGRITVTLHSQNLTGTYSTSGSLISRAISRQLTGTYSTSGLITVRAIVRQLTATYSASGALTKRAIARALTATYSSSGLITARAIARSLSGTYSATGALTKRALTRTLTATYSISGGLTRAISRALSGTYSTSGVLTSVHQHYLTLTATYSTSGSITKRAISRSLTATYSASGTLTRAITRAFSATYSTSGSLAKSLARSLSGTYSTSGVITKRTISRVLTANYSASGAITLRAITRTLTASYSASGNLAKGLARKLTGGTYSASGVLTSIETVVHYVSFAATYVASGSLIKQFNKLLTATYTTSTFFRSFIPPILVPIRFILNARALVLSIFGRGNKVSLGADEILHLTLVASPIALSLAARGSRVTLSSRDSNVTLQGQ